MTDNIKAGISIFICIVLIVMMIYNFAVASYMGSSNGMMFSVIFLVGMLVVLSQKRKSNLQP